MERRLDGFRGDLLRQVEIAEPGGEEGQEAGPVLPEHLLDRRGTHAKSGSQIVRISIREPLAPGQRAAQSIAASRSGTSIR